MTVSWRPYHWALYSSIVRNCLQPVSSMLLLRPVFAACPLEGNGRMFRIGFRRAPSGQVFDRKVFDDHRLVFADEPGRELVEEVASTILDLGVRFGDLQTGFAMVVASFLLSGESLLGLFKLLLVTVEVAWVGIFSRC